MFKLQGISNSKDLLFFFKSSLQEAFAVSRKFLFLPGDHGGREVNLLAGHAMAQSEAEGDRAGDRRRVLRILREGCGNERRAKRCRETVSGVSSTVSSAVSSVVLTMKSSMKIEL